jgi:replicative DNA helicase
MNESSRPALLRREPPVNLEAEQALLGALLANNKAYERVAEFLAPDHFADPVHARIYTAISRRVEAGQVADPVLLKAELEHDGTLAEVGGTAYLGQLISGMVGIINAGHYGRAIHDAWLRRQLVDVGEQLVNDAHAPPDGMDGQSQLEAAEQVLFDLSARNDAGQGFISFTRALAQAIGAAERAFRQPGGVAGLSTGLRDLDAKIGGLHGSDLMILAGRPGMGKSALATKIAFGAAQALAAAAPSPDGPVKHVAVFSLEMSAEQLATRLLAEEARISGDRIRRGEIGQKDFDRFVEVSRRLGSLPLEIDDTPALNLAALRARCRRIARHPKKGLGLVVVDYLQLMRPAPGTKPENRVLEISQITQGLKAIAKELNVPVLALSQLSRQVESREDKRPQLSDLRESGTIEQDADMVLFIYRDDYYLAQRMPKEMAFDNSEKFAAAMEKWQKDMDAVHNLAELYIAKQRHGPTGKIELLFEGEFTRFADLDRRHGGDD